VANYQKEQKFINKFGKRVRQLRLERNMSLEQLAYDCGIEYIQISRVELGKINTSISNVYFISAALKVETDELQIQGKMISGARKNNQLYKLLQSEKDKVALLEKMLGK
jgi:transcriptional regulator with XRE-family HTH domain